MLPRRVLSTVVVGVALALSCTSARADVLSLGDTSLALTQTSFAFSSPAGAGTVDIGSTSSGAFAGLGGTTATLQGITAATPVPLSNFLTIPTLPAAQFTLTSVGPGSSSTICGGLAVGGSCSPFAGSPFVLTNTGTGTVLAFSAGGTVRDSNTSTQANFLAVFSSELIGQTPQSVASALGSGTLHAPFSASLKIPTGTFAGTLNIGTPAMALSQTAIAFTPSAVTVGPTSTGSFNGLGGTTVTLHDITAGSPLSNFLTIPSLPAVQFTMTGIGPGSPNTNCAVSAVGQSCSPSPGSPFVLVDETGGVVVWFSLFGTALDGATNIQTPFLGTFATEVLGVSVPAVQALFQSGLFSGSFSAELTAGPFASSVAEPTTLALLAIGIAGVGLLRRRIRP